MTKIALLISAVTLCLVQGHSQHTYGKLVKVLTHCNSNNHINTWRYFLIKLCRYVTIIIYIVLFEGSYLANYSLIIGLYGNF